MSIKATGAGIGQPVPRREDLRLLRGKGCYSDDFNQPNQAYAVMLRSPHAHARIRSIDATAALALPGVLAVLTGAAYRADGLKPIPHTPWSTHPAEIVMPNREGVATFTTPHYPLPADKVRFVGEGVALVVAESIALAKDGAELVEVDYEPLPAVTDTMMAVAADAPLLWEEYGTNVCVDADVGDAAATAAAFARAAHVARIRTWVQRVTGVPMEPRAALGVYDAADGRYTLYAGSGMVVRQKQDLAQILGAPMDKIHIIMRDVGGNFGTRGGFYPEFALMPWAARRVGRPVKWTAERQELLATDFQARDLLVEAELALDAAGNFLAMRGANIGNIGAHTVSFSSLQKGVEIMSSIYRMPAAHFRARAVVSNTSPTRPYRSAGRPEVMLVMERLIDLAAAEFGFDRVDIRRRNLIAENEQPYANPFGMVYDNGAYVQVMESALVLGDWAGFAARRAAARRRGKYRGISVANYVDTATGVTRERAEMTVQPEGRIDVVIGTISNGQGHETSYAQLLVDWLGAPIDSVRLITGDSDRVSVGGGSHSGRSMRQASIALKKTSDEIISRGKRMAARLLQASDEEMEFVAARFRVKGTERSIGLFEVAAAAAAQDDLPDDLRGPLAAVSDQIHDAASFPYGAHVCEVEIDPDTGVISVPRYAAVDDVGRAVNPLIIHGQTHGGIAQGVGQALWEHCHYERESGQLLSGSFMDYAMPRANGLPFFDTEISEVPATTHPLGIRAGGEGGTTPALAVVINAVVDALAEFGVRHIEMPATAERVWRAINGLASEEEGRS